MKQIPIRFVKKNDFFRFSPEGKLWVKAHYAREIKKYSVYEYEDTAHETFLKPTRTVWVDC